MRFWSVELLYILVGVVIGAVWLTRPRRLRTRWYDRSLAEEQYLEVKITCRAEDGDTVEWHGRPRLLPLETDGAGHHTQLARIHRSRSQDLVQRKFDGGRLPAQRLRGYLP
jgi:hypothetical protein